MGNKIEKSLYHKKTGFVICCKMTKILRGCFMNDEIHTDI